MLWAAPDTPGHWTHSPLFVSMLREEAIVGRFLLVVLLHAGWGGVQVGMQNAVNFLPLLLIESF